MTDKRKDNWRQLAFSEHDSALREDVRHLGEIIGEVLSEQEGPEFLDKVEAVRTLAIERREQQDSVESLRTELHGVSRYTATALVRAFALWFQVVNTAERVHRLRRSRAYQLSNHGTQPESVAAVLEALSAQGVSTGELWHWLDRMQIEPVFTAHPTQAVRRSLLEKEQVIVRTLVDGFSERTPDEDTFASARIKMALGASWQTALTSALKPTVQDEFEQISFYLVDSVYAVIPRVYETLERELARVFTLDSAVPGMFRFGSWVGGDMDGNPNVGAHTIKETLAAQREQIIERYSSECRTLARLLSQTEDRVSINAALKQRLVHYRRDLPSLIDAVKVRHRNMPYRSMLLMMAQRLDATLTAGEFAYANASEFLQDLDLIAQSLKSNKGAHAGLHELKRLLWRARTFDFHLAQLDIRQDAREHDDILAILFADKGFHERPDAERAKLLQAFATGEQTLPASDQSRVQRLIDVFRTIKQARVDYGSAAIGPYLISMARGPADVLAVLALARAGGLVEHDHVPLDVAPLFETVDDLQQAPASLEKLLQHKVYRSHLADRGNRQIIMLGYSDSAKGDGILAARFALQKAQTHMLAVARKAGVELIFFHGRGGSASRGGGKVVPALMASPRGSVNGKLRMTDQGEVIHAKYGIYGLALRSLEQMLGATLKASLRPLQPDAREDAWFQALEHMSVKSRSTYRSLVTHKHFVSYFRQATPIDVIERMAIGSRPASRRSMRGVEDLRAIPWVFSWTQTRSILTAWYGLGSALQFGIDEYGLKFMQDMAREWSFFANLLNDVEMVLAKTDMQIAEAFSQLAGPLHASFFPSIKAEWQRTHDLLLKLNGHDELLEVEPRLAQSIRLRNPYIDPISLLQVDFLRQWRAGNSIDDELLNVLVACVNGVAQGLQNTG